MESPAETAKASGESPPPSERRVIGVAGGRGGTGTSILAVNLGVYLAQLGRTVVLSDADPAGADLHSMLNLDASILIDKTDEAQSEELTPVPTPVPGLLLLPQAYSRGSTVPVRPGRRPRWARHLKQLDVDYVILDLGSGTAPATLDLFLEADFGICTTTAEPPSVEATYRFGRALFQRRIRKAIVRDRFRFRMFERALGDLPPLPSPKTLVNSLSRYDSAMGERAAAELHNLVPRLIVNATRLRQDTELGSAMSDVAYRYLGLRFEPAGSVEYDDAVWLSVVRRHPLLIDSPTSKSARNLERIARRVLALLTTQPAAPKDVAPPILDSEPNLYEMLAVHPGATDEELRRAYKRQRDIYQRGSLPLSSLLTDKERQSELSRIEEAHDTLLDPLRRQAYDLSAFPELEPNQPAHSSAVDEALEAERAMLRQELSREINSETEFTGQLLRKVRQAHGIELEEIANRTKISRGHLQAIEAEDFAHLPALVYTRGFVQQVAKYLKLDPTQVSRTFVRRMRQWRATIDSDRP